MRVLATGDGVADEVADLAGEWCRAVGSGTGAVCAVGGGEIVTNYERSSVFSRYLVVYKTVKTSIFMTVSIVNWRCGTVSDFGRETPHLDGWRSSHGGLAVQA